MDLNAICGAVSLRVSTRSDLRNFMASSTVYIFEESHSFMTLIIN